jgi:hypothetical protein
MRREEKLKKKTYKIKLLVVCFVFTLQKETLLHRVLVVEIPLYNTTPHGYAIRTTCNGSTHAEIE